MGRARVGISLAGLPRRLQRRSRGARSGRHLRLDHQAVEVKIIASSTPQKIRLVGA